MSNPKYPDFYLRKRQREQRYRTIMYWAKISLGGILGIGIGLILYFTYLHPTKRSPVDSGQQGATLQEMEQEDAIANAAQPEAMPGQSNESVTVTPVNLAPQNLSEIEYSGSFPVVNVGLLASVSAESLTRRQEETDSSPATDVDEDTTEETDPHEITEANPTPPEDTQEGSLLDEVAAADEADSVEPEPAETAEATEGTTEQAADEEPAEDPTPPAAADKVFHVYAGYFDSESSAKDAAGELSGIGLQGSVIFTEPMWSVKVASYDDLGKAQALHNKLLANGFNRAFYTHSTN